MVTETVIYLLVLHVDEAWDFFRGFKSVDRIVKHVDVILAGSHMQDRHAVALRLKQCRPVVN